MNRSFGPTSTTDDVLQGMDLAGKRYLVTGVSSGIGIETARALVAHGAEVVGTARDLHKAAKATAEVDAARLRRGGAFEIIDLDLADLRSVRAACDRLYADGRPFDGLVANAGVMATPFGHTRDGFETQFGTNHLGHFLLINRLAGLIRPGGRVVTLSSNGHRWSDVDLEDPNFQHKPYDPWAAYGASKTAVVLLAVEFERRHRARGVHACSLMPGVSQTGLARHLSEQDLSMLKQRIERELGAAKQPAFAFKTLEQVAATSVWAAVVADAEEVGGRYCQDCQVAPVDDAPGLRNGVMSYALDPERARRLWTVSEALVGERYRA